MRTDSRVSHDYQSVKNTRDLAQREVQRLRGVVNTQERQVSTMHCEASILILCHYDQVTQLTGEVDSLKQSLSTQTKDNTRLKNTLTKLTEQKD